MSQNVPATRGVAATTDCGAFKAHAAIPVRVLVVDADADARALYRDALSAAGYEVVEACDGRDALTKALADPPPTLIVAELHLPFVDGYALCEILRRDAATRPVPILVVTADTRSTALNRIREAGASAVLLKPAPPEIIVGEVRHLLTPAAEHSGVAQGDPPVNRVFKRDGRVLVKSHSRFWTSTPPKPPPSLTCPLCDVPLAYEHSHVGGVSDRHPEQWDYYTCPRCGTFQYRPRTRKIRRV